MRLFHGWALFLLLFSFDEGGGLKLPFLANLPPPLRVRPALSGR